MPSVRLKECIQHNSHAQHTLYGAQCILSPIELFSPTVTAKLEKRFQFGYLIHSIGAIKMKVKIFNHGILLLADKFMLLYLFFNMKSIFHIFNNKIHYLEIQKKNINKLLLTSFVKKKKLLKIYGGNQQLFKFSCNKNWQSSWMRRKRLAHAVFTFSYTTSVMGQNRFCLQSNKSQKSLRHLKSTENTIWGTPENVSSVHQSVRYHDNSRSRPLDKFYANVPLKQIRIYYGHAQ